MSDIWITTLKKEVTKFGILLVFAMTEFTYVSCNKWLKSFFFFQRELILKPQNCNSGQDYTRSYLHPEQNWNELNNRKVKPTNCEGSQTKTIVKVHRTRKG